MTLTLKEQNYNNNTIEKFKKYWSDNQFDYSNTIIKSKEPFIIRCVKHNYEFSLKKTNHHLRCVGGCPLCGKEAMGNTKNKKEYYSDEECEVFFNLCNITHNNMYDYSNSKYIGVNNPITIFCPKHNEYFTISRAHRHKDGQKCPHCVKEQEMTQEHIDSIKKGKSINFGKKWILDASIKHNYKYDYSKSIYINRKIKIEIICPDHGSFWTSATQHKIGKGFCPTCLSLQKRSTIEEFIEKAKQVHHDEIFDYTKAVYINVITKILIICPNGHEFLQTPNDHLCGKGCKFCTKTISKIGTEWLLSLNIPDLIREHYIIPGTKIKADGYSPSQHCVYEFLGDYYHGNLNKYKPNDVNTLLKQTFQELYNKTQERSQKIREAGYNLVEMWEYDWKKIRKILK